MVPKVAALRLPAGARKFARFTTLTAPPRNCSLVRSPTATFLLAATSNCPKPGPRTVSPPASPHGCLGSAALAQFWFLERKVHYQ